ncbi:hypothetical protein niasHT_021800 [Heterodera trifolii]|uniref:K Homology domain-containing protein n=1 Tax=Heterodera trifolii TaxID=157864 RepID=A0ABD2J8J7_9BILA
MHTTAAPPPHQPSVVMSSIDDNNSVRFPIIQVEVKIRVPDHLVGRLIGKSGICVKKIMEDTQSHISISESRSQQEVNQYQTPELLDRIITIRGTAFGSVMAAEKQVQQKLRHIQEQDMNISGGGGGVSAASGRQFCPTPVPAPPGGILQSMDGGGGAAIGSYIAPSAVTVTGAPMLSRGPPDNAFHHHPPTAAAMYSAQCIPMGVAPQAFFVHNHLATGQFAHNIAVPNLPNLVHVKSRVYVPNQIVGILIGTKGQTIKSISAESGAVISIKAEMTKKGGREEKGDGGTVPGKEDTGTVSVTDEADGGTTTTAAGANDGRTTAPIEDNNANATTGDNNSSETVAENNGSSAATVTNNSGSTIATVTTDHSGSTAGTDNSGSNATTCEQSTATHVQQQRTYDSNNTLRPVFIQGYDFQVSKAQYWVFQKVADSQNKSVDEIELACEAIVPSRVIGRIIGKGGHNVKKLQQSSGARIKVPDDIRGNTKSSGDWATVSIYGNFYAVQAVQQHFGALISEVEWRDSREQDERRSRHWNGGNSR